MADAPTTSSSVPPHPALSGAVLLLLAVLPVGHLLSLPVGGALATATDLVTGAVAVGFVVAVLGRGAVRAPLVAAFRGSPGTPARSFLMGCGVLTLFAIWVAASGQWGYHAGYAVAKGLAVAGLVAAAAAIAFSNTSWHAAVDAWLIGTGLALFVTFAGVFGPDILGLRLVYSGGGILGIDLPRIRGPWLHPNMMADHLLVSAVLLWGRWPALVGRGRRWGLALAVGIGAGFVMTLSTAWIAAGVVLWAVAGEIRKATPAARHGLRVLGALVAAGVVVAVVAPLDTTVFGHTVATSGLRPAIWRASLDAIAAGPVVGVGASPFLAEAPDPFQGGALVLWDAHNAFLSVLGQFGLIGAALLAVGLGYAVVAPVRSLPAGRVRGTLILAWTGVAIHSLFLASEDLRHVWLLVGLTGLAAVKGAGGVPEAGSASGSDQPGPSPG
ncbi:MAG: O-antigen ligase family protein [Longimicrobiales bacterium]